ncbi:MFS transporter, SP family, sugar:H+ symporter [Dorcoceras hygrometricum]|uniref:MFS transporter, SP family, sugar:H+ symporter n=1 Tax=Dorcoceras hygrometricum TaxID=472368 RepID=A0A2Z7CM34_9LAMI|nr:MFS transporter, SP family, sugar:H+ symporter [Dorcoceras hygrometricum]
MTSTVTSSFSRKQPAESFISSCYLELAFAKRCRLNKLERQRFAFAISSEAQKTMRRHAENQQKKRGAKREATSYGEASSRKPLFISRELQFNQQKQFEDKR